MAAKRRSPGNLERKDKMVLRTIFLVVTSWGTTSMDMDVIMRRSMPSGAVRWEGEAPAAMGCLHTGAGGLASA